MKQVSAALVSAQKKFEPALKDKTNPGFRSKYADLGACVDAVLSALNESGIFLCQANHECSDGVIVETLFIHESGETFSAGKLHVPAAKQDPQGYGSALTYARRYSLLAACGIAPEDDDGNAATAAVNTPAPKAPQRDHSQVLPITELLKLVEAATTAKALDDLWNAHSANLDEAQKRTLLAAGNKRKKEIFAAGVKETFPGATEVK